MLIFTGEISFFSSLISGSRGLIVPFLAKCGLVLRKLLSLPSAGYAVILHLCSLPTSCLVGDICRLNYFCLAYSFLTAVSCFRAILRDLSTVGRFLTSSVASRLSSDGSLSLPLLESPLPAFKRSLFYCSSANKL